MPHGKSILSFIAALLVSLIFIAFISFTAQNRNSDIQEDMSFPENGNIALFGINIEVPEKIYVNIEKHLTLCAEISYTIFPKFLNDGIKNTALSIFGIISNMISSMYGAVKFLIYGNM